MDVVARTVIETGVEQGPPVTTACLIRIGVFLNPSATLLIRLFAGLLISHIVILSFVGFKRHIIPCGGGSPVMPVRGGRGKPEAPRNLCGLGQTLGLRQISKLFVLANQFFEMDLLVRFDFGGKFGD